MLKKDLKSFISSLFLSDSFNMLSVTTDERVSNGFY